MFQQVNEARFSEEEKNKYCSLAVKDRGNLLNALLEAPL